MIRSTVSRSILSQSRPAAARLSPIRPLLGSLLPAASPKTCPHYQAQRTLFTARKPTMGSRFRGTIVRFGLAAAIVYWYNTSAIFAEEPSDKQPYISRAPPVEPLPEEHYLSLDELSEQKKAAKKNKKPSSPPPTGTVAGESTVAASAVEIDREPRSPESLEEEAGQQGAFNEETGEINWDCPCLGGMAHGPCGEEFREAFSCFVFSKEEPKGVDCIEKFKGMQTCFQKFPEIYGEPPSDDEEEEEIDRKLAELDSPPPPNESDLSGGKAAPPPPPPSDDNTPPSSLPHPPPQGKGLDEYSHPAPADKSGSKPGTLGHPEPGEKGIGGGSHEGPVDTDAATAGIIRPAPSNAGLEGIGSHGAPGVKGVGDSSGPRM